MKITSKKGTHSALLIRNLSIKTKIPIHPKFFDNPSGYARSHSIKLAKAIHSESHFKTEKRDATLIQKDQYNIHLFRQGAIRLLVDPERKLRCIDLSPSILLFGLERQPLRVGDLPFALSILKETVTPLLANPDDSIHIIPGLVEEKELIAYWKNFETDFLLHGQNILSLYGLNHPDTSGPHGSESKRIQLGDQNDPCFICFEPRKMRASDVESINVNLILKGMKLSNAFEGLGTKKMINGESRLIAFPEDSFALVHQNMMSRLQGDYLPVPPEWENKVGKGSRNASMTKTIALLSKLMDRPCEELLDLALMLNNPSDEVFEGWENDLLIESSRLNSVPVSSLFHPGAYPLLTPGVSSRLCEMNEDIVRVYGVSSA